MGKAVGLKMCKVELKGGTLLAKYLPLGRETHDLYSLVQMGYLDNTLTEKAVQLVFLHRKTPLENLPITFDRAAFETLQKSWDLYRRKLKMKKRALALPESIEDVVFYLNQWLIGSLTGSAKR